MKNLKASIGFLNNLKPSNYPKTCCDHLIKLMTRRLHKRHLRTRRWLTPTLAHTKLTHIDPNDEKYITLYYLINYNPFKHQNYKKKRNFIYGPLNTRYVISSIVNFHRLRVVSVSETKLKWLRNRRIFLNMICLSEKSNC